MADEVDLRPGVGVGVQMGGHLLDPVFPADGDPGGNGGPDGLVALDLGGGHQRDLGGVPPHLPGGGGDILLHLLNVLFQRHK